MHLKVPTIRVLLLVSNLLAEELLAGSGVTASSFGVQSLAAIGAEPSGKRCPSIVDVVGDTVSMCSSAKSLSQKQAEDKCYQTHELSESRYLWTSKMRLSVVPSGLVTLSRAGPEPLEMNVSAEV